jgi:hypothetical protein
VDGHPVGQTARVLGAGSGEGRVAANLAEDVVPGVAPRRGAAERSEAGAAAEGACVASDTGGHRGTPGSRGARGEGSALGLAVAGEVDDVGCGMDRREELRDAHAQVAVHPVRDHLAAVVVELDVREVIL